ncbi:cupin domain-containing protein [Olivibacter sp. SDN3]|nr:cupin domain-containing protein [Olivibacter sp. SDN3]QNL52632.1 cupin domain-containing protein [Olivibacter sp. SDN3]
MFYLDNETGWTDLGGGLRRKIMSFNDQLMMVKVRFEKGAVGELHQHFHTQQTFVASGVFEFTIGAQKKIIKRGDSCLMPSNVLHGCVCIEEGELIDIFSPIREDFLS